MMSTVIIIQPKPSNMNKKINQLFLTVLVLGTMQLTARSQSNPQVLLASNNTVTSAVAAEDKPAAEKVAVPGKVSQKFTAAFPAATNVKWVSTNESYLASFKSEEKTFNATFTKKGQFVYALIYG